MMILSGCSFPRPFEDTREEPDAALDAAPPLEIDAMPRVVDAAPDAPACQAGFLDLCASMPRPESLSVEGIIEIDSDNDSRCVTRVQSGGPDICLLYFEAVSIPQGANLRVYGNRPVALAARTTFSLHGELDISTRRTRLFRPAAGRNGPCNPHMSTPVSATGGGGGGAGGSFRNVGGDGGDGNASNSIGGRAGAALVLPTVLRGGCPGQAGASGRADGTGGGEGGPSGGAGYLYAKGALTISGVLYATGSGGAGGAGGGGGSAGGGGGGGGGGSGGMVVIESATSTTITNLGRVLTNGGGGGEGGDYAANVAGQPGADAYSGAAAPGGASGSVVGDGGRGATFSGSSERPAGLGHSSAGGAGGGGGSTGFIIVRGPNRQLSGTMVPPATLP